MKRTIEYDLVTKIEANARFASKKGMFAKSNRTKDQREATRQVLQHLGSPPPLHVIRRSDGSHVGLGAAVGLTVPNVIKVRFTRIAPGQTADAWENLPGAFKAVKDEVAAWIGCDDKEGRGITWLPPEQEKGEPAVYRVRIEIEDLIEGEPKTVILAERASEGRLAKTRMKRQVTAAKKRQAQPSALDLRDAAERALSRPRASDNCHERPEIVMALDQLGRGRDPGPSLQSCVARPVQGAVVARMDNEAQGVATFGKRSALASRDPGEEAPARDLRDAYLLLAKGAPGAEDLVRSMMPKRPAADVRELNGANTGSAVYGKRSKRSVLSSKDLGEEAVARDLADCEICGSRTGVGCKQIGSEKLVHGVHEGRARAAGVHRDTKPGNGRKRHAGLAEAMREADAYYEDVRRKNEETKRRVATMPGEPRLVPRPCYVRMPWSTKDIRDERLDRRDRDVQRYRVPAEHREKWGAEVVLTRERAEGADGVYWLYSWKEGS